MKRPITRVGHRFFSELPIDDRARVELGNDEAHHLSKVMRCEVGDEIVVFDGSGREYRACVAKIAKSTVILDILESKTVDRELNFLLTLGVALPRGDRQRWLIEKSVEIGVTRLIPLETRRGVAQPTPDACARLRRAVVEACKQCGRNTLMEVGPPEAIASFLRRDDSIRWIASPEGRMFRSLDGDSRRNNPSGPIPSVAVAVGPEGGFDPNEILDAEQLGWQIVSLGPRILRVETAALVLCGALTLSFTQSS